MPREKVVPLRWDITDKNGHTVDAGVGAPSAVPDGGHILYSPAVELNWSREFGHVQLSIEFPREQWLEISEGLKDDPSIVSKAIYSDGLTRPQINDMIRTLRRARDAVYGKDE